MKRKTLIVLLVVMLGVMLFTLTGCGNSDSEKTKTNEKEVEKSSVTINKENTVEIEKIVSEYNSGIAVVEGKDGNIYMINENGEVKADLTKQLKSNIKGKYLGILNYNGYLTIEPFKYDSYIIDKEGKVVFEINENIKYGAVSKDGYVAIQKTINNLSGNTTIMQIIDLQENVVYEDENITSTFEYVVDDIFVVDGIDRYGTPNKGYFIDLKDKNNKKKIELGGILHKPSTYPDYDGIAVKDGIIVVDESSATDYFIDAKTFVKYEIAELNFSNSSRKIINSNYYLIIDNDGEEKYYINKIDQASKTDSLGETAVKDLSEGGVAYIEYYNGVYYVISKTGYFYTLDDDFNYILEPVKDTKSKMFLTSEGVVVQNVVETKGGDVGIIDKNGKIEENLIEKFNLNKRY